MSSSVTPLSLSLPLPPFLLPPVFTIESVGTMSQEKAFRTFTIYENQKRK
jgi:hypothetical protein